MGSIQDVTDSFAKRVLNPSAKHVEVSGCRVKTFGERDVIYSYGGHFPMAEVLRNGDGSPRLLLVNGDRFSVSTTNHQSHLRGSLQKYAPDVPKLIVPFSALEAARIRRRSIELLSAKPEGYTYTERRSVELPKGAEMMEKCKTSWGANHNSFNAPDSDELVWAVKSTESFGWQEIREQSGVFVWHGVRHWLGDAVFSALPEFGRGTRRKKFISSFDRQESRPLYFLCELPRTRATTLEEALEALKPETVVLAEGMGRTVTRQGDMFAVPMPGLTRTNLRKQGATFSEAPKSVSLIGTAHTATAVATMPDGMQYARGSMYHVPAIVGESWRNADHRRQRMGDGKTWHLIVKNTVPVSK